jgi:hypothetical protein
MNAPLMSFLCSHALKRMNRGLNAARIGIVYRTMMCHPLLPAAATVACALMTAIPGPLLAQPQVSFAELKTVKGKVLLKARVLAVEPDGLRLSHETGVSKIAFADLPEPVREQYPHDPVKAAEFAAKAEAAHRAAIQSAEEERARFEHDERCRRAGLPPGFHIPVDGPLTVEHVKGRWLLDNVAHMPGFGDPDRAARESAIEYRKQLILSGVFDREAEKIALRHNLEWYLHNDKSPLAEVARLRLADMEEEERKHAELAALERLADSIARIATESTWRSNYITSELGRIRRELWRMRDHDVLHVHRAQ